MLCLRRHLIRNLESSSSRTLGVTEHMQLCHIQPLNKTVSILKQFIGLTTHTNNDIYTDERIGHNTLYASHLLGKHLTAGLSAIYARHKVDMQYTNELFPYDWNNNNLLFKQRHYDLSADYQNIEVSLPLSYYLFTSKDPIRPYVYVEPRFSYALDGNMILKTTDSIPRTQPTTVVDTASFAPLNHTQFNVGATMGIGTQFRISMEYYYFHIKLDVSANWYFLNTYTEQCLQNEFYNKRYNADAQATITFMFPLKKRLFDACHIMR